MGTREYKTVYFGKGTLNVYGNKDGSNDKRISFSTEVLCLYRDYIIDTLDLCEIFVEYLVIAFLYMKKEQRYWY